MAVLFFFKKGIGYKCDRGPVATKCERGVPNYIILDKYRS